VQAARKATEECRRQCNLEHQSYSSRELIWIADNAMARRAPSISWFGFRAIDYDPVLRHAI
jgi:hypothetical protein